MPLENDRIRLSFVVENLDVLAEFADAQGGLRVNCTWEETAKGVMVVFYNTDAGRKMADEFEDFLLEEEIRYLRHAEEVTCA